MPTGFLRASATSGPLLSSTWSLVTGPRRTSLRIPTSRITILWRWICHWISFPLCLRSLLVYLIPRNQPQHCWNLTYHVHWYSGNRWECTRKLTRSCMWSWKTETQWNILREILINSGISNSLNTTLLEAKVLKIIPTTNQITIRMKIKESTLYRVRQLAYSQQQRQDLRTSRMLSNLSML